MNKLLARLLGYLNGALAVIIIFSFAFFAISTRNPETFLEGFLVGWIGALVGLFFAILTCGLLAILISIRDELKTINKNLKGSDTEEE